MIGAFERLLWASRLIVIVAVVASVLAAIGALVMASVDVLTVLAMLGPYVDPSLPQQTRDALNAMIVGGIVKAVDGYLLTAILLIFGIGMYELFVGQIDAIERSAFAERLLLIRTFDDLKDRLTKVVLVILIVKFLQVALQLSYRTPLDLLYLAIGIALIGGAVYLSNPKGKPGP